MDKKSLQVEGELFEAVQKSEMFDDSKTFPDAILTTNKEAALEDFRNKDIKTAVNKNFEIPESPSISIDDRSSMRAYIESSWDSLLQSSSDKSTLIPLENRYVAPGGRFREQYYWDSYFAMLGLKASGRTKILRGMVENFASLIERFGFIPNGNRIYFLDRSQPPFFAYMINLLPENERTKYRENLKEEYRFWMERRTVETEKGDRLNHYWSEKTVPRPESYTEDFETGGSENFRGIRAACESGWDFSSRWANNGLESIRITDIAPVDLNCFLYENERTLSELSSEPEKSEKYREKMFRRKKLIDKYFWNERKGFYFDYDLEKQRQTDTWSLAGAVPLYVEAASQEQAEQVAENLEEKFLEKAGFVTTLTRSGHQWDYPNGWAPLQWIVYQGLRNYGFDQLAETAAERWIEMNREIFHETGKMFEKYNVVDPMYEVEDGEYSVQEGFGWTNGVTLMMLKKLGETSSSVSSEEITQNNCFESSPNNQSL